MKKLLAPLVAVATVSCVARARTPEAAVAAVARERFRSFASLDLRRYASTLAADALVVGVQANDVIIGRGDVIASAESEVTDHQVLMVRRRERSTRLRVNVAADGQAAWISDVLEFDLDTGVSRATMPIRVSEVLGLERGRWVVLASHWSVGVPDADALEAAADGRMPELVPIPDIVDAGVDDLANQISRELRAPGALSAAIDDAPDFVLIGTADEDVVEGGTSAREVLRRKAEQLGLGFAREGKNRVALAPGGHVAWSVTNLDARATYAGSQVTLPMRALLVYEQRGGAWRLVQAHLSHGLEGPIGL